MPNHDRRSFLVALGTGVLAAAGLDAAVLSCARSSPSEGTDGAAGTTTGSNAGADSAATGGRPLGPIGLQLYTLRNQMQQDVAGTLARVARVGYKQVEFYDAGAAGYFHGKSAKEIRALLDANGLRSPSAHIPLAAIQTRWDAVLDQARAVGNEYVLLAWVDAEQRRTLDDWRRIAELCNRSAERAKAGGLQFAYHNHDFEFTPVEGKVPYELLLAETDRNLVQLEMDLYWAVKAGQDPLGWFAKYPGRFPLLHVKDSAGAPEHRMTAVGQGTIPFPRIFAKRDLAGTRHLYVEQDNATDAADPWALIETSYKYMSGVTA